MFQMEERAAPTTMPRQTTFGVAATEENQGFQVLSHPLPSAIGSLLILLSTYWPSKILKH